jgi:manganese/zinc/iron transport system permease protein
MTMPPFRIPKHTLVERPAITALTATLLAFAAVMMLTDQTGTRFDHTLRTVTLGGALLGLVTGALGSFAVLRRQSLLGDALSHAALPGVALAFLLQGRSLTGLLIGAAFASLMAMGFMSALTRTTRIKTDAAQAITLTAWFALGLMLLSYIQGRSDAAQAGLDRFIFGQAAALMQNDLWLIAGIGVIIFALVMAFWPIFKLLTFDPEYAAALGMPVRFFSSLLSVLMVATIVMGLQLAGVVLMVGLLIAPASAARQWTNQLGVMVLLSGVFGAFAGGSGALLSALDLNLPTGPLMIVMACAVVLISVLVAPQRGLIWRWKKQRSRASVYHSTTIPLNDSRAPSQSSAD